MSEERREGVEADLTQRRRDLERLVRDAEADLGRKRAKGVRELEEAVASVIGDYAERNGYTLILQRDFCAYAVPSIDVSSDIVRLIDARTP
jgi:outer membrane protein